MDAPLSFQSLKDKQRSIRDGFPDDFGLRIHRSISWLGRAEDMDDDDIRFILLWIGFNSAYARDFEEELNEHQRLGGYFEALVDMDEEQRIYDVVWERLFTDSIRTLLNNQYVFSPFWKYHNGTPGYDDWEARLGRERKAIHGAIEKEKTAVILSILFRRLYVLRNQLVHGGATWNSKVNRHQVKNGAKVMEWLLPIFIDIMMDNPHHDWGPPYYPVVNLDGGS